ncbi:MAG TPA: TetR/AcrR family transcriptional regulator [Nocardioides sp.]
MPASHTGERRADARRNIESILDAATACLAADADASVADIAKAAGVGRVTLYGHFPSRADLIAAALDRTVDHASELLDSLDLGGDPRDALRVLVQEAWSSLGGLVALHDAAARALPAERLRRAHARPMRLVEELIARGRDVGVFRTDQPAGWLGAVFFSTIHAAADEVHRGQLDSAQAGPLVASTLLAAYTLP